MCTLIVLDRIVPGAPLVVALNRDELYSRPAAPPTRVDPEEEGVPAYVAPQDLEAGGTWMGINTRGLFVGLTNRSTADRGRGRRSRGLLVTDALRRTSAAAAVEELEAEMNAGTLAETYGPFYAFLGDGRDAYLAAAHRQGGAPEARIQVLDPGLHVIGNCEPDDPGSAKIARNREAVAQIDLGKPLDEICDALAGVLRSHRDPASPLESPCVHTPEHGTCSSAILAIGGPRWRFWHAAGPPCETKYANLSSLLEEIR